TEFGETAAASPVGAENIGDENGFSQTPVSTLSDLDDDVIAAGVGPGALSQAIGPEAAREAVCDGFRSRVGSAEDRVGHLPAEAVDPLLQPLHQTLHQQVRQPAGGYAVAGDAVDSEDARLLGNLSALDQAESKLAAYESKLN
ncbi:MAG: hypothetical protein LBB58_06340, partial [Cellulomonadaceae bacterium]|nr:hypothetical protein [Cellulomonadaceae bacterium]